MKWYIIMLQSSLIVYRVNELVQMVMKLHFSNLQSMTCLDVQVNQNPSYYEMTTSVCSELLEIIVQYICITSKFYNQLKIIKSMTYQIMTYSVSLPKLNLRCNNHRWDTMSGGMVLIQAP